MANGEKVSIKSIQKPCMQQESEKIYDLAWTPESTEEGEAITKQELFSTLSGDS